MDGTYVCDTTEAPPAPRLARAQLPCCAVDAIGFIAWVSGSGRRMVINHVRLRLNQASMPSHASSSHRCRPVAYYLSLENAEHSNTHIRSAEQQES